MSADPLDEATVARNKGDYSTALRLFSSLADQGDAAAQYDLGIMYRNGQGAPQDFAEAAKWWQLAADQGHAGAQYNLGIMFDNGSGVPQDRSLADKWFGLSAAQGYQYAMGKLDTGAPETQKSAVAIIDDLLTRDLLDWTRSDLMGFRSEAAAGNLNENDEKYIRKLYARIPIVKAPYVPAAPPSYRSYPVEQSWLEGFIGRLTLVGAIVLIVIAVVIIASVSISVFLEAKGNLIERIVMAVLAVAGVALCIWIFARFMFGVAMLCLAIIAVPFRALYWLLVGK